MIASLLLQVIGREDTITEKEVFLKHAYYYALWWPERKLAAVFALSRTIRKKRVGGYLRCAMAVIIIISWFYFLIT